MKAANSLHLSTKVLISTRALGSVQASVRVLVSASRAPSSTRLRHSRTTFRLLLPTLPSGPPLSLRSGSKHQLTNLLPESTSSPSNSSSSCHLPQPRHLLPFLEIPTRPPHLLWAFRTFFRDWTACPRTFPPPGTPT